MKALVKSINFGIIIFIFHLCHPYHLFVFAKYLVQTFYIYCLFDFVYFALQNFQSGVCFIEQPWFPAAIPVYFLRLDVVFQC